MLPEVTYPAKAVWSITPHTSGELLKISAVDLHRNHKVKLLLLMCDVVSHWWRMWVKAYPEAFRLLCEISSWL